MTIAVGIVSNVGAVIATDSQRTEPDCSISLTFDKTLAVSDWFIAGIVGLQVYSGKTTGEHIVAAIGSKWKSAETCSRSLTDYFRTTLAAVSLDEVGFEHRRIELLMVVRPRRAQGIPRVSVLEIVPRADCLDFESKPNSWSPWAVTGDESARQPIVAELEQRGDAALAGLNVVELGKFAEQLIVSGIEASGENPNCRPQKSCGGTPRVRYLRFLR